MGAASVHIPSWGFAVPLRGVTGVRASFVGRKDMKKKPLVVGICILSISILGAVTVETVNRLVVEPRTVFSWSDLFERYLVQREQYGPIVPPSVSCADAAEQIESGDWSFLSENWQFKFGGEVLYVAEKSKLSKYPLPVKLMVYEDLQRGEIVILSSTDDETYQAEALFQAPELRIDEASLSALSKELSSPLSAEEKSIWMFHELAPRRVVWEVTLKPEASAWTDLIRTEETAAASPALLDGGEMMAMASVPPEHTNDLWLAIGRNNPPDITVFAPDSFTNRVEIYATDNLVSNVWTIAAQNLLPTDTNPASWTVSSAGTCGFFRAGNMDIDTDGDTLPDAREKIVHKTSETLWDTDGDWMPDGWELTNSLNALTGDGTADADGDGLENRDEYQQETDPGNTDSDGDGLSDLMEITLGTDPRLSDTDEDGLPDGWEVRFGYDPLGTAGTLSGTDGIGTFDSDGTALAVEVRNETAYLADGRGGLKILDMHHPGGREMGSLALDGEANSLLLTNDTLWISLDSQGIAAVDVSDPFRPRKTGSYYIDGSTRGLALQSNLLYVANTANDLVILQAGQVERITPVGSYAHGMLQGRDICVSGTNAWLALEDRVYRLDITDPSNPVYISNNGNPGDNISEIELIGSDLCVANKGGTLTVWDQALTASVGLFSTASSVYGIGLQSNRLLIAEGAGYAELIDLSDRSDPELITGISESGFMYDAALHGERGYLAAGETGLKVIQFGATDSDADGMDDSWETLHFGSTAYTATNDFDSDGIFNREEYLCGMNPALADSDGDGLSDSDEIHLYLSDPTRTDGDLDGVSDSVEVNTYGTDAGLADTDGDGMPDGWEILYGFDPLTDDSAGDADADGLPNAGEYWNYTHPLVGDSDGDNLSDGWEIVHNTSVFSTNQPLASSFEQVAVRDTAGEARSLFVDNNTLYVADGTNGLLLFDLSIPSAPSLISTLNTDGFASDVIVSNQTAYVADGSGGLLIASVSNAASPTCSGVFSADDVRGVFIQGSYAYLANGASDDLLIVDISDPAMPVQTGRHAGYREMRDIFVHGSFAYAAVYRDIKRYNISDPANPVMDAAYSGGPSPSPDITGVHGNGSLIALATGSGGMILLNNDVVYQSGYDTPGTAVGVYIRDQYAYIADGAAGVLVTDISVPSSPVLKHRSDTAGTAMAVFPNGEYVYAADGTNGIAVFRFVEDTDQDGMSDFWETDCFGDLSQTATGDFDGDGLCNWGEYLIAGNPCTNDADGDMLTDYAEVWTYRTQPLNSDTDFDGRSDYAEINGTDGTAATDPLDADCDDDNLPDGAEVANSTDPHNPDSDGDGMPDGWEVQNGLSPTVANAGNDADSDSLSNFAEYQNGSKADHPDTDGDGLNDGDEITAGTGLLTADSDHDGLLDGAEVHTHGTDPLSSHSDADSMPDGWEVENSLNPVSDDAAADEDSDGLTNEEEYQYGTMADDSDSDNDGYSDYYEITHGLNPSSRDSDGDGIDDDEDDIAAGFEVMIPGEVTNYVHFFTYFGDNPGEPMYAGTHVFVPSNLPPTNVTLNITNVIFTGKVRDAFQINGTNFAWEYAPTTFSNNITATVAPTLGGTNTTGFSIDIYNWINLSAQNNYSDLHGDCYIQFEEGAPVTAGLIPDWDRNGTIDTNDVGRTALATPFHFWVNDDNDEGTDEGDDIPEAYHPDGESGGVDGVRDLIDFFPVQIVISNSAPEYINSTNGFRWYLCHKDSALNLVETDLSAADAGDYLYDVSAATDLGNDSTDRITDSGWELSNSFLNKILSGQDVILLEAREATTEPLRLELRDAEDEVVGSRELPLSISGVEDMFRHKNLRDDLEGGNAQSDRLNSPSNWPDNMSNSKYVFMLHGFNVSGQEARGWHSEMFKRLWWSGSKAKFVGVSWFGNQSKGLIPGKLSYHYNVQNAFKTAPLLRNYLNTVAGEKIVIAHSLGNMVVSSAIQDYSADVDKYFMVNAAVASEAYDPALYDTVNMVHPDWDAYPNRLWCSEWHILFDGILDFRTNLTWRGRFSDTISVAYNFYSPGEDVLGVRDAYPSVVSWNELLNWTFHEYAWWKQELLKGRNHLLPIAGSLYGGWGFNNEYDDYTPAQAAAISNEVLRIEPFFDNDKVWPLYHNSGSLYAQEYYDQLLAEMIPAVSKPAGLMALTPLQPLRNFNMEDLQNGWPRGSLDWYHSDFKKVAYPYVYKLYDKFESEGGLGE